MRLSFVTENTVDVASDVNQSLLEADGLIVSRVTGIVTSPPAGLVDGQRVAIATGATGDFGGWVRLVYVATGAFWNSAPALCVSMPFTLVMDQIGWQHKYTGNGTEVMCTKETQSKIYNYTTWEV